MEAFKRVSSPLEMGLDAGAVVRFFDRNRDLGIHTLAVVRDGKACAVGVRPWDVEAPHTLFSLSKSFCSMAAGLAVSEGLLSYDDSVAEVLADVLPEKHDPKLQDVKLRHLLGMSSGLDEKSDTHSIRGKNDWARDILSYKVKYEPGTRFHYNTMGTYLAGRMVAKRTGMSLRDYLMPRLFGPLEITRPQWDCCPQGFNTAGFGLHLSCMSIAKVAQLMQNRGMWGEKRLLPEEYVREATKKQTDNRNPDNPGDSDWEQGYGWQFWRAKHGRYRGDGMYGQVMMMDEAHNLALAVTAGVNDMGKEMTALHGLLDDLAGSKASSRNTAALRRLEKDIGFPYPQDDGSPVPGILAREGSFFFRDSRSLRFEHPDEDTVRMIYRGPGMKVPSMVTFGRDQEYRGEHVTYVPGERPQAYIGRYGVKDGALRAQMLFPEGPYTLLLTAAPEKNGIRVRTEGVGFESMDCLFLPAPGNTKDDA